MSICRPSSVWKKPVVTQTRSVMTQTSCRLILSSLLKWTSLLSHPTGKETEAQRGVVDSNCAGSSVRAAGSPRSWHSPPPPTHTHTLSLVRVACVGLQETPPLLEDSHQKFGNSWESPGMRAFEVRGQTTLLALLHTGLFSLPDTVPRAYSCYW